MAKRKYVKRSEYWNNIQKKNQITFNAIASSDEFFKPDLIGDGYYSEASTRMSARSSSISTLAEKSSDRFSNIRDGYLPYNYGRDYIDAKDTIELCQKAYFNIGCVKTAIDVVSELSNTNYFLDGGTAKSKKFTEAWLKRIDVKSLKEMFFREYFRSGNVFLYRLEGKIESEKAKSSLAFYGGRRSKSAIPVRYLLLNPADISVKSDVNFRTHSFHKVLTTYEKARLQKPETQREKDLFEALPKRAQEAIKRGDFSIRTYLPLEPEFLHACFYKKQDYEPLAVPMVFCILDDLDKKMEFKKIEQAIARTVENVVLLVTMGAEPDKGGINHANVKAMQQLFVNKSVGRVLVSDYTTKADFVMPDLKKVMGPEKYEILNQDIKDGLACLLIGENKYSDASTKIQVFVARLEEARETFFDRFLNEELVRVCKKIGIQNPPQIKWAKNDLNDQMELRKMAIRLGELGVLTPEQVIKMTNTGAMPTEEELLEQQKEYKKNRENGLYLPIVNGISLFQNKQSESEKPDEAEEKEESEENNENPNGATSGGRPIGVSNANYFSRKGIIEAVKKMNEFEFSALAKFGEKFGAESINEQSEKTVASLCESIFCCHKEEKWEEALSQVFEDMNVVLDWTTSPELLSLAAEHELDDRSASILWHSLKNSV